jgi:hypothetical protein
VNVNQSINFIIFIVLKQSHVNEHGDAALKQSHVNEHGDAASDQLHMAAASVLPSILRLGTLAEADEGYVAQLHYLSV